VDQINETELNKSIAGTPWLPLGETHPADIYTSVTDGVGKAWDADLAYRLTRAYHGQVAETDYMMGMALDALAASPAADNTWILFTSDHGEMHLEHRVVQKMSMYEGSERIPMIVVAPPSIKTARRGVVKTTLVSLLDIFPTFLELAYNPGPGNLDGFSLGCLSSCPAALFSTARSTDPPLQLLRRERLPWLRVQISSWMSSLGRRQTQRSLWSVISSGN
jgi:arylsulfatase K